MNDHAHSLILPAYATQTFALSWGVPAWVGNQTYFSQEGVEYQISWMKCVKEKAGIVVDTLGVWNGELEGG